MRGAVRAEAREVGLAGGLEGGADGPEDEGEPDQGDVFGQAGSDVDFDQAVGDEDVGHGGDEAGVAAQPGADVAVHRQPGGDDRRAKQQLYRLGVAETHELHQQRAQERRQRPVDQEERDSHSQRKTPATSGPASGRRS